MHRVLKSGTVFGHGTCLLADMMLRQHISRGGFRLAAATSGELPAGQVSVTGLSDISRAVLWLDKESFARMA